MFKAHTLLIAAPLVLVLASALPGAQPVTTRASIPAWLDPYRDAASRLIGAALADHTAWHRVAEVTDTFGPRLSGSPALDAAITWAAARMRQDGFDEVRLEPVKVPKWVRGRESLSLLKPFPRPLVMLGLGGSVGTPSNGLEAEAIVVSNYAELEARAADARGRIVVYDVPFTTYGETVQYRGGGASRAARLGAVAALVRAVGPVGLRTPHTGGVNYADDAPQIPAAAISAEDAAALSRLQQRGEPVVLRLSMDARMEPEADSANVVAEIRGREHPEEVVVLGGHFDSWDVGTGASDDAVGCVVAWEAARLMKAIGLKPRRTVRVVLFTNEENGLRGGLGYRDRHRDALARHVLMIEADLGVFSPLSMGVSGSDRARERLRDIATLLSGLGIRVDAAGGGADIGPSVQAADLPGGSVSGDPGRYFLIHHTPADTVDRIDPQDVSKAVATLAVWSYLAAEMPERFGDPR